MARPTTQENPVSNVAKYAIGTITFVGAILGAFLTVDARYVLAADFDKFQQGNQRELARQTQEIQKQGIVLRKQLLEDRVFELDTKKSQERLSPIEEAQYNRYMRQLNELDSSLHQLDRTK